MPFIFDTWERNKLSIFLFPVARGSCNVSHELSHPVCTN
ncbi:hypothetical protein pah_c260o004 [Parachlamydia acanthamoebae str. Hall's coccus]|nr:hypothetical protein pah_c260o004 [Parachlamydia acanthamoebae str. Hall's coccus]